jgi:hypothetical protein
MIQKARPMNLSDRIIAVAEAARPFSWLGEVTENKIHEWIELEFGGDPEGERRYGDQSYRCIPLTPILHIVSGNTPHAALQSLIRGILVGSENRIKIPSSDLPELKDFSARLPVELKPQLNNTLPATWMRDAEAVVVFGSDETIRHFSATIEPHQRFLPHGNKISFGLVLNAFEEGLIARAARDVFLFDQLGCLSPQSYFVAKDSETFAAGLADALEKLALTEPRTQPRSTETAATLRAYREEWKYRAATEAGVHIWESGTSLEWTVIHAPSLASTPLHRTIFVHPLPDNLEQQLKFVRPYLSTVGVDRVDSGVIELAILLGAQRICSIGEMQNPPLTWHHNGWPNLTSLVRYVDIERA